MIDYLEYYTTISNLSENNKLLCNYWRCSPYGGKGLLVPGEALRDLVWWHHFRAKGPTRADIAQLPVTHARTLPRELLRGHVTSGSHVGHTQWYILYYYYRKKKTRDLVAHAHAITSCPGHFRERDFRSGSLPVTSLPVTWVPVTSLPVDPPFDPPEIRLEPCSYTTKHSPPTVVTKQVSDQKIVWIWRNYLVNFSIFTDRFKILFLRRGICSMYIYIPLREFWGFPWAYRL